MHPVAGAIIVGDRKQRVFGSRLGPRQRQILINDLSIENFF